MITLLVISMALNAIFIRFLYVQGKWARMYRDDGLRWKNQADEYWADSNKNFRCWMAEIDRKK